MWEPCRLTIVWASIACYKDSFNFYLFFLFLLVTCFSFHCTELEHNALAFIQVIVSVLKNFMLSNFRTWSNLDLFLKKKSMMFHFKVPCCYWNVEVLVFNIFTLSLFFSFTLLSRGFALCCRHLMYALLFILLKLWIIVYHTDSDYGFMQPMK
jgi:hypothetical protein